MNKCDNCNKKMIDDQDNNYINEQYIICDNCYWDQYQICDNCNNSTKREDIKQQYNDFNPTEYSSLWDLCPKCYTKWKEYEK